MSPFDQFLRAIRDELAPLCATVTTGAREQATPPAQASAEAWQRHVDRGDLNASLEVLDRLGPGGFSAALHSRFGELLDGLTDPDRTSEPVSAGASPAGRLTFSLKDETEVEEDIEVARLVQMVESKAEGSLRELRALSTALRGWTEVRAEAPPLHPQACARVLLEATRRLSLSPAARRVLLRMTAPALGAALADLYPRQIEQIKGWGVKPARYTIRLTADARTVNPGPMATAASSARDWEADPGSGGATPASSHEARPAHAPANSAAIEALLHHLLKEVSGHGSGYPGPGSGRTMATLVRRLPDEAGVAPALRGVFEPLEVPGARLADDAPEVWQDRAHPWWQLLDRLVVLCENYESQTDGLQEALALLVAPILADLGAAPDSAALADGSLCRQALNAVDAAVHQFSHGAPETTATGAEGVDTEPTPMAEDPLEELSQQIRDQMSRQIRSTTAPLVVRRFLQGPWVRVLATALDPDQGDRARALRYTRMVDELLGPSDPAQPRPLELDAAQSLLNEARAALSYAGIPDALAESHLAGLGHHLFEDRQEVAADVDPAADQAQHAALPTVPVELGSSTGNARARRDRLAWLDSLRAGDRMRLFLDGQWVTLQLLHCDPSADQYQFKGRDARPGYCLTRTALERLRAEGLATTLDLVA